MILFFEAMKVLSTTVLLMLEMCLLTLGIVPVAGETTTVPLPQKLSGPQLQRDDCVVGERDDSFAPYIEEFLFTDTRAGLTLYSCINWQKGFLKSEGIGKKGSQRAAEMVARNNALKTLLVLNVHATSTLQDYLQRQRQVELKIQDVLVKNAKIQNLPVDPKRPDDAKVIVTIPFYGISGLTSFLIGDKELYLEPPVSPSQPPQQETPPEPGEYTGIILDVRGIDDIEPALFPQVISEDGEVIYEASQIEKDILQTQGVVEYVTAPEDPTSWRTGTNPLIIKPVLLASATVSPSLFLAQAEPRKRRRKGNSLAVQATESAGQIPVNVVVSVEDAKKIKTLHEKQHVDKQGKYTILIGGEIGGVKGQYPASLFVMHRN